MSCKSEKPAPVAKPAAPPAPVKAEKKAIGGTAKRSADGCVGPLTDGAPQSGPAKTFAIAGRDWELKGSTLVEKTHDDDRAMVVGVVADLKEDTPDNLANIDKFLTFFKQERAEMIFVVGDTGETKAQIANNLKRIAQSGLPVGVIIGNRECRADFNAAVDEVAAKANNVFNLNTVRRIIADDAEFLTMPGYFNPAYLHCVQDGCQYYEEDVMALAPLVDKAAHPVTLISHGPPRQSGPNAIDRISEGSNEGDPSLTKLISEKEIPFGIFANIHEAGGKATDLSGENVLRESIASDSFYLNPGPGDAVRWTMNNGSESVGMAAIVAYKGTSASYRTFKVTAAVASKAKK